MALNNALKGQQFYDDDETLQTIDYIKLEKKTRQVLYHCVSGDVITMHEDDVVAFEVTTELKNKKANKRIRSKRR